TSGPHQKSAPPPRGTDPLGGSRPQQLPSRSPGKSVWHSTLACPCLDLTSNDSASIAGILIIGSRCCLFHRPRPAGFDFRFFFERLCALSACKQFTHFHTLDQ